MHQPLPNRPSPRQLELELDQPAAVPVWRPVHYIGSKLRLVNAIRAHIARLCHPGDTVCDLFAGSGTVSLALSPDYTIVAADIQEYSRVLCSALLHPAVIGASAIADASDAIAERFDKLRVCLHPLFDYEDKAVELAGRDPALLCDLVEHGSMISHHPTNASLAQAVRLSMGMMDRAGARLLATKYFGGTYFSYRQALTMDCAISWIDQLPMRERDTYLAALLSTASTVVNTIGKQFAQPIRPRRTDGSIKSHLIGQMVRDRCIDVNAAFGRWLERYGALPQGGKHRAIRGDYREVLADLGKVSLIYADPPYTRDHYSRFYHVLETLCRRDSPDVSRATIRGNSCLSRGMYRADRHQSPFCIRSEAPGAFADLFAGASCLGVPLLLSYSPYEKNGHPRLLTVEDIVRIARRHYKAIEVVPVDGVTHSKLNRQELHLSACPNAEVFVICTQ